MNPSIGVFYGSTRDNTREAAGKITARLSERMPDMHDVHSADPTDLEPHDILLFGVPTWNVRNNTSSDSDSTPTMSRT